MKMKKLGPILFRCSSCGAEYKIVMVEPPIKRAEQFRTRVAIPHFPLPKELFCLNTFSRSARLPIPPRSHARRYPYHLVHAEGGPDLSDSELTCLTCGGPLQGRKGRFVLKYFFVDKDGQTSPATTVETANAPRP